MNFKKKYIIKNREGYKEYDLKKKFWKDRKNGISAMMRIKNEEEWIEYSILSIRDCCDEIVVVLQNCTDRTEDIIRSLNLPNIKILYFPFESFPNQPDYFQFPIDSVHNRAYYYNWALNQTSFKWVLKWDGDQAMFEEASKIIRRIISEDFDIVHFYGIDIFDKEFKFMCSEPYCGNEPSLFKVNSRTFYYPGDLCEYFSYPVRKSPIRKSKIYNIQEPIFLHFKYISSEERKTLGLSPNWNDIQQFKEIMKRKSKGKEYNGVIPKVLLPHFEKLK